VLELCDVDIADAGEQADLVVDQEERGVLAGQALEITVPGIHSDFSTCSFLLLALVSGAPDVIDRTGSPRSGTRSRARRAHPRASAIDARPRVRSGQFR
jgi:hypothetical protein